MEAVPRMPMLAFELKTSPEQIEFGPTLKSYITSAYHEDGNAYAKESSDLDALRISAANVSRDFMGCSTLKKYFCQLKYLESRFPMGERGPAAIPFTWEDPYVGRQYMVADIQFEQAAILYNIGTLHSILGATDNRQTPEGMKVSCTHFQCAAWAYQHLRDTYGPSAGVEYTHDFLTFHINLMLAQSQECILEKSMTDNRKSTITAKVAAQIVEYYRLALANLEASNAINFVGNRKFKDWKKRIELKSHYHKCVMYLHMGMQAEEHQKWGERVVWFNSALQELNDSMKLAKNEDSDIDEALRFTMDVVGGKYNNAKKDNDFIYHDKVPEFESLPEVKGASLVKGIPFNPTDPEVAGPDIFQRLVPMEAHEASSLYSEEKAKLLRQVGTDVEEKDGELSQFLASLSLNKSLLNPQPFRLPQHLLDKCAALSVKPDTITDLKKAMTALSNVATDVGSMVAEIQSLLKENDEQEKEYQDIFGMRSPNTVLIDIGKECAVLGEQCQKGGQSDMALHRAMQNHISDLTMLALPPSELEKTLPAMEEKTPEEEATHMEMNRLMDKIDEMKTQRDTLHSTLRQNVHDDDITSTLVTREEGDQENFFAEQLNKHSKLINLLNQNLTAQENILRAVTEANAKYAPIRKRITETIARREAKIASLSASYEAYENLLGKSQRGMEYYQKLEDKASRLLERAKSLIKVDQEGREARLAKLKPKGPPPSRPTAPKPGQDFQNIYPGGLPDGGMPPGLQDGAYPIPGVSPTSLPTGLMGGGGMGVLPAAPGLLPADAAEKPRAPTLKDYLPFMKPGTFGPKAGNKAKPSIHPGVIPGGLGPGSGAGGVDPYSMYGGTASLNQIPQVPAGQGSLPNSQSNSPIHLPHQPSSQPASPAHPAMGIQSNISQYPGQMPPSGPPYQHGSHNQQMMRPASSPQQIPDNSSQIPASQPASYPNAQVPTSQPFPSSQQQQQPQNQPQQAQAQPPKHPQHPMPPQFQQYGHPHNTQAGGIPPQPVSMSGVPVASVQPMISSQQADQQQQQQIHSAQTAKIQPYPSGQAPASGQQPITGQHQHPGMVPRPDNMAVGAQSGTQAASQAQYGYLPPGAQQPQATMRDEAAHTVDMLHTPIASPGETPSSYIGAQSSTWTAPISSEHRPGTASHTPGQHQSLGSTSQSQTAPGSVGYQQNQPQIPQQPVASVPNTGYPQPPQPMASANSRFQQPGATKAALPNVAPTSQYMGYGGYKTTNAAPTVPPQQYPQGQPSMPGQPGATPQQYPQGYQAQPGHYPVAAGYNAYGQTQSQQQQQQQPVSQYNYNNMAASVPGVQTQYNKPGYQPAVASVKPQQNYPTPAVANTRVGAPYQTPQGAAQQQYPTAAAINYPTQPPANQPNQTAVPQAQPPSSMTYPQTGTTGYPGYQAGAQGQGYRYPSPQQQQQQQPPQQPLQGPLSSTMTPQRYPVAQAGYAQPGNVVYQQGYIQNSVSPAHSSPSKPMYGTQSREIPTSGISTSASGQTSYPAQVPVPSGGYVQQQKQATYAVPGQAVGTTGGVEQGNTYSGYPTQAPGVATSDVWSNQAYKANPQQKQYQYYMQQQQQQQQQPDNAQYKSHTQQQPYVAPTSQAAYNHNLPQQQQQQIQQYPGYMQYNQQYPQQSYPQQTQQQKQIPPTQLPISRTNPPHPAPNPTNSIFTSPDSPQVDLPSPLQPSLPSPAQPNMQKPPLPQPQPQPQPQRASSAPPETQPAQRPQTFERQNSHTSNASSLDDLLSSSPDVDTGKKESGMLTPKVITAEELQQQREEELKKSLKQQGKCDPYEEKAALDRFVSEVEKFEKLVEALDKHTLSGPTPLENEWKELGDEQVKIARNHSQGIARCYPAKNRSPDVMPYDHNRVMLKGSPDDYINASFIGDLAPCCPKFITCQSPLPVTMEDFWLMVHEQGTEVIVMLAHEGESGMQKIHRYWPAEKGQPLQQGRFTLTLQSVKVKQFWVERIITLAHNESHQSRSVVHLQFIHWPPSGSPDSPNSLLSFISEVHTFYIQQRTLIRPVIIHCSDGVGRTGAFCIIYTAVQEVNQGNGVRDVAELVRILRERRKYMVQEKEQLAFCYRAILYHCQSLLIKRGIITNKASFGDKIPGPGEKSHQRKPSEDFILGNTTSLSFIQSSVAKMTVKSSTPPPTDGSQDQMTGSSVNGDQATTVPSPMVDGAVDCTAHEYVTSEPGLLHGEGTGGAVVVGSEGDLSGMGSPVVQRSRSASGSSGVSHPSASASPQHQPPTAAPGDTNRVAQSLADLQNPDKFSLDMGEVSHKPKKFSKAEFHKGGGMQESSSADPNDPLALLDPLWSVKDKSTS